METLKLTFRYLIDVIVWLLFGIFISCLLFSFFSGKSLFGNRHLYIVQSGSMEPSIMTGDIIVTTAERIYQKNDVITFSSPERGVVTHRIVEVTVQGKDSSFITKGDANRSTDSDEINLDQIIGKVDLVLPRLGYLVFFSREPVGVLVLIGIPGLIIIFEELLKLRQKNKVKS